MHLNLLTAAVGTMSLLTLQAETLQWTPMLEPGVGGAVTALAIDPNNSTHVMVGGDMLGIGCSFDGGKTWTPANTGLKTYEIAEFTFDPANSNTVWVGTMDGPYKSLDGGRSWTQKRAGMPADGQWGKFILPIQKILIDPSTSSRLLAFGGNKRRFEDGRCFNYGSVWESTDSGEHWTLKGQIDQDKTNHEANITGVAFAAGHAKTLYASVPGYGLMRSDDSGGRWQAMTNGIPSRDVSFLAVHPVSADILWVSTDKHGVYKSTDGGNHWNASNGGLDTNGFLDTISVATSAPNILFLNANNQTKTWRSIDGGEHWSVVLTNGDNPYGMSLVTSYVTVDPRNSSNVFVGTFVSIYHSTDGGNTWQDASAYQVDVAQNTWRGAGYSGLVCENFTWNPFDLSMSVGQAMDDGKFLLSRDDMKSWKVHHPGMSEYSGGTEVSFCQENGTTVIYAAVGMQVAWFTQDGIYKSVDNAKSWKPTASPNQNKGARSVYAFPRDPQKVFAVFADDQLYRSIDGGASWTKVALQNPNGKPELSVGNVTGNSSTNNPSQLYAAARGGIYTSADQGMSWTYMTNSPNAGFDWPYGHLRVKCDPGNDRGLLVVNVNGINGVDGVYRFDGTVWSGKLAGSYSGIGAGITDASIDPRNGKHILAVCNQQPFQDMSTSTGVWETEDGGKTWRQQNTGLGMLRLQSVTFRPDGKVIVVGSNGGGFYVARPNEK